MHAELGSRLLKGTIKTCSLFPLRACDFSWRVCVCYYIYIYVLNRYLKRLKTRLDHHEYKWSSDNSYPFRLDSDSFTEVTRRRILSRRRHCLRGPSSIPLGRGSSSQWRSGSKGFTCSEFVTKRASNLLARTLNSNGLHPSSDGLYPNLCWYDRHLNFRSEVHFVGLFPSMMIWKWMISCWKKTLPAGSCRLTILCVCVLR